VAAVEEHREMLDDNFSGKTYSDAMARGQPFIQLRIEFKEPIEIGAFVGAFAGLSGNYERYMRENHPDLAPEAELFIEQIESGSIIVDLLPWATLVGLPAMYGYMEQALLIEDFVRRWGDRLLTYVNPNGRAKDATKSELRDYVDSIAAIARDPDGKLELHAIAFEDGKREIRAIAKFNTKQAQIAKTELERHQIELERPEVTPPRQRVVMIFRQTNVNTSDPGKRTGEKVVVGDVSERVLPVIYGGDMVEQQIKHEIVEADENVYKRGFVVDVAIETKPGTRKPIAYRVLKLHTVFDLDED
jgi:hypothetical protein